MKEDPAVYRETEDDVDERAALEAAWRRKYVESLTAEDREEMRQTVDIDVMAKVRGIIERLESKEQAKVS